jgi:hemerythrin-like metal-binding protein
MALLEWSPSYELDVALMDETHREFADLVNQVGEASDAELVARFDNLIEHTVAHFEQENLWMQECGFPPIDCHVGEHNRVIQALRSVRSLLLRGDLAIARRAAEEMSPWFANHAATMDAALAFHIKRSGYTPVHLPAKQAA